MRKHKSESKSYQGELDFNAKNNIDEVVKSNSHVNINLHRKTTVISFSKALAESKKIKEDNLRRIVLQNTKSF
ncbi:hypothetical protein DBR32_03380 [Taibaiella sp. KBW10]|uniref:hypothetical protein n=1 Tax=Taibaiella sp. KBW10 TaxID=2153357 RepID=UPI000F5982A5|nr:hypothetical protein [Taibaiella sp. KBW10]RQO32648.1 hypothetical protein DBR32_03380 [Taibaiella sp. KBW10]